MYFVMPKAQEFASVRLPVEMKRKVRQLGRIQRWSLSKTMYVLIEEALEAREQAKVVGTSNLVRATDGQPQPTLS